MIYTVSGWRHFWRTKLCWFPIQFCMVCGKAHWAGLPLPSWDQIKRGGFWQWLPAWNDYCSHACCEEDCRAIEETHRTMTTGPQNTDLLL